MLSSMLEGLYKPDNAVKTDCGSPNCAWKEVQTLGICDYCEDISSSLKTKCQYHNPNIGVADGGGVCRYQTPSGGELEAYCYSNAGGSQSSLWNSTTILSAPPDIMKIAAISFEAHDPGLSNCAFNPSFARPQPTATECSVSWCAESISSRVINGTLAGIITSHTNLVFPKDPCNAALSKNVDLGWVLNKLPWVNFNEKPAPDVGVFAAFLPGDVPRNMCAGW